MAKSIRILIVCLLLCSCASRSTPSAQSKKVERASFVATGKSEGGVEKRGGTRATARSLTAGQRAEWDKIRRRRTFHPEFSEVRGVPFYLVGYIGQRWNKYGRNQNADLGWGNVGWMAFTDQYDIHFGRPKAADELIATGEEDAIGTAGTLISTPGVKLIAVIDLFSKRDPTVVMWVTLSPEGPLGSKIPPSAEVADSLKEFLFGVQLSVAEGVGLTGR